MANAVGLIRESIWRDRDFRALPRTAQATYLQVLSQKDLDCAGVLILHIEYLTKGCDEMSVDNLWHDLKILEQTRFLFVDSDTDELFIRSYIRLVAVRSPNMWKAVKRRAKYIESLKIRSVLAGELRRLGKPDADDLANEITAGQNPSGTHPEPIRNPSERGNPSERVPEPPAYGLRLTAISPSVGGWVGRAPDGAPSCPKHPTGPKHDEPCRDCQRIREHTEATQAARAAAEIEERRAHRAAINDCPYCDDNGLRELDDNTLTRCSHNPDTFHDEDW